MPRTIVHDEPILRKCASEEAAFVMQHHTVFVRLQITRVDELLEGHPSQFVLRTRDLVYSLGGVRVHGISHHEDA